jgi:dolichyl-phosphate beta-glucosyltransferase
MIDLSIIIPLHNERQRLLPAVQAILDWIDKSGLVVEVLLIENGSTDYTYYLARGCMWAWPGIVQAYSLAQRGKGAAVRCGMLHARGEWRFMCDVDLSMPLSELTRFWNVRRQADVTIASREAPGASRYGEPWQRHVMGRLFNFLAHQMTPLLQDDTQCGFKLFSAQAAEDVFRSSLCNGLGFDIEILWIALICGYGIVEMPVTWTHDADSRIRPVRDSIGMLRELLAIRRNARSGLYGRVSIPGSVTNFPLTISSV